MAVSIQSLERGLANLSLAGVWRMVRDPRMSLVRLAAPPASTITDAASFLFPDETRESVERCRLEFVGNHLFFAELDRRLFETRHRRAVYEDWWELLYLAVRFARPGVVFETGVFDGQSSAVVLQALDDNGAGQLISIDLPATSTIGGSTQCMLEASLPAGCAPGWAIPDRLRSRQRLVLGDSKEWLPRLLAEHPRIDIFFHDSLHTYEHMYFEYSLAWRHLPEGGLLLSDDIFWSAAFHRFCKERRSAYVHSGRFGATRKPHGALGRSRESPAGGPGSTAG